MKNTLMFLLVSLLLAVCLTACGGGQTNGAAGEYGTTGQTGTDTGNGSVGQAGTNAGTGSGSAAVPNGGDSYGDSSLMDDARDAVDDAGRSVRNAMDDAGNAMERAF